MPTETIQCGLVFSKIHDVALKKYYLPMMPHMGSSIGRFQDNSIASLQR